MMLYLLCALILIDTVVLLVVLARFRTKGIKEELLFELHEERSVMEDLLTNMKAIADRSAQESKERIARVEQLVCEAEQETKTVGDNMAKGLESAMKDLDSMIADPIKQLESQKGSVQILLRKLDQEKRIVESLVSRTEKLALLLNAELSYDEMFERIKSQKFEDARQFLAQGLSPAKVAKDLGLSLKELRLIGDTTQASSAANGR